MLSGELSADALKWKKRNERILTAVSPAWTLLFLLLAINDHAAGRPLSIFALAPMVMGLLGSITGLIVRCQILEHRLYVLEARRAEIAVR